MPPVADFACLGKKCRTPEGEATVYELPLGSQRCPVCSSKRLQRLFNSAPMVNSGAAKRLSEFVRPSLDAAEAPKLKAQDDLRTGRVIPSFSVDRNHIGRDLSGVGLHPTMAAAYAQRLGNTTPAKVTSVTDPVLRKASVRTNVVAQWDGQK